LENQIDGKLKKEVKDLARKFLLSFVAIVVTLAIVFAGCGDGGGGAPIPYLNDGWFVQETIGGPETLDPAWAYDTASGEQIQYVYETLIFFDGESVDTFVPVLATSVPTYNATDHTYRFTIREGVTFHEGGNLTPEDVEYSFERHMVQDRSGGPIWMFYQPLLGTWGWSGNFSEVDAAVEVDGNDVVFTLVGDYWALVFLQILSGPWASIVDKEWCVANGEWDGTAGDAPNHNNPVSGTSYLWSEMNGTGPWKLNEWDVGNQVVLLKYDDYWRALAPFERVITKQVDEWTARKLSLQAGEADLVYVPRQYIGELDDITDLNKEQDLPELAVDAFFMNFDIAVNSSWIGSGALDGNGIPTDFFSDIDVRKGFNYAFDWDTYLNDILLGEATQIGSPVCDGLYGYNPSASKYSLCLTAAATHFQNAWGGAVWTNGFSFTLLYNAGNDVRKAACEILADNLFAINTKFKITVLPLDWGTGMVPELVTHNLPCFQIGWLADYAHADNFVVPFMHSTGTFSYFQAYGYPALDDKITAAFQDTNPVTQQAKYDEIQEIYYEDAPGIILSQPLGRRFFTKYIDGFYFNPCIPGNAGPLYYMSKSES
jgi:peptide/nickel transport system substrate-binding protein